MFPFPIGLLVEKGRGKPEDDEFGFVSPKPKGLNDFDFCESPSSVLIVRSKLNDFGKSSPLGFGLVELGRPNENEGFGEPSFSVLGFGPKLNAGFLIESPSPKMDFDEPKLPKEKGDLASGLGFDEPNPVKDGFCESLSSG